MVRAMDTLGGHSGLAAVRGGGVASPVQVDMDDAIELVELLELIGDWAARRDAGIAWSRFVGAAYGRDELRRDLTRFVLLLGGLPADDLGAAGEP
jgi:hypothetical protein